MKTLKKIILSIVVLSIPFAIFAAQLPQAPAIFQTSLSFPILTTDTSMTLASNTLLGGAALPAGFTCFTLDQGNPNTEYVCGTVSGTTVSSLVRGIDPIDGKTSDSNLIFSHRRGADVKITDFPILTLLQRIINGSDTIQNIISYTTHPTFTANTQLIDKQYADGLAIAGAPDSSTTVKGIGKLSVAPVLSTNPIFVGDNDTRVPPINTSTMTAGQVAALPGNNTDVAVGSGNKYVTQTGLQHNAEKYAADSSGSSTAYVITLSPAPTSYTTGMVVYARIGLSNTTTNPTINVNVLGAVTIVKGTSTPLAIGDIGNNSFNIFIYNGANFVLQNTPANNLFGQTGLGTYTNLGTITSGTISQATKDLMVIVILTGTSGVQAAVGVTDSNPSPTTTITQVNTNATYSSVLTMIFPVRKNDYWKVVYGGTITAYTINLNNI